MRERDFQIEFERQLQTMLPGYNVTTKLNSDMIFSYINRAKDEYVKQLYRAFQQNQEITDKLRTLVKKKIYVKADFTVEDKATNDRWSTNYPDDYLFTLGEETYIDIYSKACPLLVNKSRDVIEATIETVDRILENSLSEYHLHHNQARPIRLYTENKILLITDGNYGITRYILTYLSNAKDLGKDLKSEYIDLPEVTHKEIVNAAVRIYVSEAASTRQSEKSDNN